MLIFLAVHPERGFTNDEIRNATAGPDDEASAPTIRSYLSRVRTGMGGDFLPDAEGGRYRLKNVDTDVARLEQLLR
ncbi:MAG: helix-turn-helix domain-containing protein [Acidimicrobiales bacterium]